MDRKIVRKTTEYEERIGGINDYDESMMGGENFQRLTKEMTRSDAPLRNTLQNSNLDPNESNEMDHNYGNSSYDNTTSYNMNRNMTYNDSNNDTQNKKGRISSEGYTGTGHETSSNYMYQNNSNHSESDNMGGGNNPRRKITTNVMNIVKLDDTINYNENNNFLRALNPEMTMVNTNKDIETINKTNIKQMMMSIQKLNPCNNIIMYSDLNHKVCSLTDMNIKSLLSKEYESELSPIFIRKLKYKIYSSKTLSMLGGFIAEHQETRITPSGEKPNKVNVVVEFDHTKNCYDYMNDNIALDQFDTAMFYKLGNKFICGGLVYNHEHLDELMKSMAMWKDYGIVKVVIDYYQTLSDIFCDIHYYSQVNERITLSVKSGNHISIQKLIEDGYELNKKRYMYKLYKQAKLRIKLTDLNADEMK